MNNDKIAVIGLGYIGLPTSALFALQGVTVLGVDTNPKVVDSLNKGEVHIVEPGLEEIVKDVVQSGHFKAYTNPQQASTYIIAVPTPFKENHQPDLSYVFSVATTISPLLKKGSLVILESTSPVGTTEKVSTLLSELRPDLSFPHHERDNPDVNIAYCPERVLPGKALKELIENDRIIGGMTPACTHKATGLYKIFVKGACIPSEAKTAEMAKLTENAFRDVNIAFANELSLLCDKFDINVWELINLANHHPRVNILRPGPGVGGHCIAVDPWFLVWSCPEDTKMIRAAREVNDYKPKHIIKKVETLSLQLNHPAVACFGLSFKADIDDLRESPAVEIVETLAKNHPAQKIFVVEPYVSELPDTLKPFANLHLVSSEEALKNAKIVLMLVNHKEFYTIPKSQLKKHHVVDTQGVWSL